MKGDPEEAGDIETEEEHCVAERYVIRREDTVGEIEAGEREKRVRGKSW